MILFCCWAPTYNNLPNGTGLTRMRSVTTDESALIQLRFHNGTIGDIKLDMGAAGSKHKQGKEIAFLCEKGALYVELTQGNIEVYDDKDEKIFTCEREQLPDSRLNFPWGHGTVLFAEAIAHQLRSGKEQVAFPLAATFEDGHYVQKVIDACHRSNELGAWVDV